MVPARPASIQDLYLCASRVSEVWGSETTPASAKPASPARVSTWSRFKRVFRGGTSKVISPLPRPRIGNLGRTHRELTMGARHPLNETKREPETPCRTYYLATCSEADAGGANRTPGQVNLINGLLLSPMISADCRDSEFGCPSAVLNCEIVYGPIFLVSLDSLTVSENLEVCYE